jgi:hypothetical protein
MDAGMLGLLHRLQSPLDVAFLRPGKTHHHRPLDVLGDTLHRCKISLGRGGKTSLNDIDPELLQLAGDHNLLLDVHARPWGLLPVSQGSIEDLHDLTVTGNPI